MQTTLQGAIALAGQDINNVCQKDGKTLARLSWLRLWPKNPRIVDDKNLKKLESQIVNLGVYKPLVITADGEILGGNQRFKVLTELAKKDGIYEWVWVSIVDAWTDTDRLKYALSDNFSAGEYTREKLKEVIGMEQKSLFSDFDIDFSNKQEIDDFIDELAVTEDELKARALEKHLQEAGISEDIITDVKAMSNFAGKYDDSKIEAGSGVCQFNDKKVFLIKLFFEEKDEKIFNELKEVQGTKGNVYIKTERLLKYLKNEPEPAEFNGGVMI